MIFILYNMKPEGIQCSRKHRLEFSAIWLAEILLLKNLFDLQIIVIRLKNVYI